MCTTCQECRGIPSLKAHQMSKKEHEITDELLEHLLTRVEDPKDLRGSEGLQRRLTARLVDKSLEVELGERRGHERGGSRPGENARNGVIPFFAFGPDIRSGGRAADGRSGCRRAATSPRLATRARTHPR